VKPKILVRTKNLSKSEWLAYRRKGIGGSDAAALVGLNPYSSAFSVFMDKLGLAADVEESEAMWLGVQLEPILAERFMQETGLKVERRNVIYQHPEHSHLLANIDRWIVSKNAGLEIKTTSMMNKTDFNSGEIPANYYCQCMHYMAVTGASEWWVAVAVLGKGFHIFRIERNEDEINALIEVERAFWENNVLKNVAPLPDGSASAANVIKLKYPTARGDGQMVPLFGMEGKVSRILELDDQIKLLEKESDRLKQVIELDIGEADGGRTQNHFIYWKTQSRSSIDAKRLQSELPDVYQRYLRSSSYRKFEIKMIKDGEKIA